MTDGAPGLVLALLAAAGGLALVYRLLGGLFRATVGASWEVASRDLAEVRARHGDLTGMAEHGSTARAARRIRWSGALWSLLWAAWLVLPLHLGGARWAYAAAAALWLLPKPGRPRGRRDTPGMSRASAPPDPR